MKPEIQAVLDGESDGVIITGDCLEIMAGMPDGCVDALCVDPPYGVDLGNHHGSKENRAGLLRKKWGYEDSPEHFTQVIVPRCKTAIQLAKRAMVWCVPPSMWQLPAPNAIGGVFVAGAVGRNKWGWSTLIHCLLYGIAPGLEKGAKPTATNLTTTAEKTGHPTTKPLLWMEWALRLGSRRGEVVLDCMAGSGTTCVAAKKLGRRYIGIEISPKYAEIARNRVRNTPKPLFTEPAEKPEQAELFAETP